MDDDALRATKQGYQDLLDEQEDLLEELLLEMEERCPTMR